MPQACDLCHLALGWCCLTHLHELLCPDAERGPGEMREGFGERQAGKAARALTGRTQPPPLSFGFTGNTHPFPALLQLKTRNPLGTRLFRNQKTKCTLLHFN